VASFGSLHVLVYPVNLTPEECYNPFQAGILRALKSWGGTIWSPPLSVLKRVKLFYLLLMHILSSVDARFTKLLSFLYLRPLSINLLSPK